MALKLHLVILLALIVVAQGCLNFGSSQRSSRSSSRRRSSSESSESSHSSNGGGSDYGGEHGLKSYHPGTPTPQSLCGLVDMYSRSQWNADKAKTGLKTIKEPLEEVYIHHTALANETPCYNYLDCSKRVRNYQISHMKLPRDYKDIGYHFLIGADGKVYEGRGWNTQGAHIYVPGKDYNMESYGIAFIGNYDLETSVVPTQMIDAAKNLIECGIRKGHIRRRHSVFGHKDVYRFEEKTKTECPGKKLYHALLDWDNFYGEELPGLDELY